MMDLWDDLQPTLKSYQKLNDFVRDVLGPGFAPNKIMRLAQDYAEESVVAALKLRDDGAAGQGGAQEEES